MPMLFCAAPYTEAEQLAAITALNLVGSNYVILFRGRTVAPSPAEAQTRVHNFGRNFCGCQAITNHAALPDEYAVRGGAGQTARWIRARRYRPRDERRDQ
jgi:hypothetical protein